MAASATAQIEASTQQEWNQGNFSGTTADRPLDEGALSLGYSNGTSGDSLIGYWRLDRSVSGNGGTVRDYSGRDNDAVAYNGVSTSVDGVFDTRAFSFDGSDDYVEIPGASEFSGGADATFTISVWFKAEDITGTQSLVSKQVNTEDGDWGLDVRESCSDWADCNGNSPYIHYYSEDGGNDYGLGHGPISAGEWHQATLVLDQASHNLYIYLDGELVAQDESIPQISHSSSVNPYIGNDQNYGWPFQGKIDEVRIYDETMSNQQIQDMYDETRPRGLHSRKIEASDSWQTLEVNSSLIPQGTDVDAVFRPLDSSGNAVDEQVIDLNEGMRNYSLDVSGGEKAEIIFNGSSQNMTKSWRIDSFKVFSGFCDYRGPESECVVNTTRQLSQQVYNVDTFFESKSNAVFKGFGGAVTVNVSNSSILSGLWRGSLSIQSGETRIVSGAKFRPEGGRIVIGD